MKDYCRVHISGLSPGIRIIICITLLHHVVLYTQAATPYPLSGCVSGRDGILSIDELDIVLKWMPDTFTNPDDICETQLGEGSYLCRDEYSGNYSSICGGVWCGDPSSGQCTLVDANDGVQCGNKKWCRNGECRFSDQAVAIPNSCPFGDSPMTSGIGISCPDMISRDKKLCYDATIEQTCCQSCQAVSIFLKGCNYGDRTDGCRRDDCSLMTADDLLSCCQTCSNFLPTEKPPTTSITPRTSQGTTRSAIEPSTRIPPIDQRTTEMSRPSRTHTSTFSTSQDVRTNNGQGTSTSRTSATRTTSPTTNRPQSTVNLPSESTTPVQAPDTTSHRPGTTVITAVRTRTTTAQAPDTTSNRPGTTVITAVRTGTTTAQAPDTTTGQPGTTVITAVRTGTTTAQAPDTTSGQSGTTAITGGRTGTTTAQAPDTTSGQSDTTANTGGRTGTTTAQAPDTTTGQPGTGVSGSQQDSPNVVAMGTGIGVGAALLIAVIVIVVYVVKKRVTTPQAPQNMEDNHSIGGDSFTRLTADMNAASTTWYPSYRTFTNMV
ncbi:uncharacterized protein PB18E9.04c-like isoform X1 [Haliotis rufescens]|uniref:uncharacterized protein PB18E9.04c-like isoform X1 n=1 Tax=Haliotis rufescens TaxID=6454 RepID=UPI00201F7155|nr:uncharacterized protein PB18E9.04c-like isoform X1 [Haliotis rufescens]